jgi:hypothetical protein
MPGVLKGSNLVFAAPTSAGKSVVYEILALRRLLTTGKPFMLVLPTVVLCQQKVSIHPHAAPECHVADARQCNGCQHTTRYPGSSNCCFLLSTLIPPPSPSSPSPSGHLP